MKFSIQRFVADESYSVSGEWVTYGDYVYYIAEGIYRQEEGGGDVMGVEGTILYAVSGGEFDPYSPEISGSETVTITLGGVNYADLTFYDSSVNGVSLNGGDKTTLTVIIGDKKYKVNASGKLEIGLPDFGLMTKADKQKLDAIDTTTLLTKTEASNTYVTKAEAITSGEMTANGFVLKNALGNGVATIPAQQ